MSSHTLIILSLLLCLTITSCAINRQETKEENNTPKRETTDKREQLCGGYTPFRTLEKEEIRLFTETYKGEIALEPFEVATQVVAGTNYRFRCRKRKSTDTYIVTIYQPLPGQGKAEVTSTEKGK